MTPTSPTHRRDTADTAGPRPRTPGAAGPAAPPPAWPTLGTTLLIAADPDGDLWAAPLAAASAHVVVAGSPIPAIGRGAPRTHGAADLTDPQTRTSLRTSVTSMLARPFRLVWGRPGTTPASHVPAWMLVHDDGTATVVDVLTAEALRAGADLMPLAETKALCKAKGWNHELLTGTDTSLDRHALIEIVLDAPDGMISGPLWAGAFEHASLPELVDAIATPGDLLWLRPYLLACWADEQARAARRPALFPRP